MKKQLSAPGVTIAHCPPRDPQSNLQNTQSKISNPSTLEDERERSILRGHNFRNFDLADPVGLGGDSQSLSTNRIGHEGHTSHCGLTQTQKLSYSIMLKITQNYGQLMGEMMFETESWGTPISDKLHIISLVESISLLGGSSLSCSLVKSQYIDWVDIIPYRKSSPIIYQLYPLISHEYPHRIISQRANVPSPFQAFPTHSHLLPVSAGHTPRHRWQRR